MVFSFERGISYLLLLLFPVLFGCNGKKKEGKNFPDTPLYNLSSPTVVKLPDELDEISGLAYYPKDSSLFAIVDEEPLLYKFSPGQPKNLHYWVFDKKRDMEDLVLKDSTFYVLVSNGDIVTVNFIGDSISSKKSDFSTESKNVFEFESLYMLDDENLTLLCKNCDLDSSGSESTFNYNISTGLYSKSLVLNTSSLKSGNSKKKFSLRASAAAVHPQTGELYIISSINSMLVIADREGRIKEVYPLDPYYYKQPEGIAFTPDGDLYISNEFADVGMATLLYMKNKKKGK